MGTLTADDDGFDTEILHPACQAGQLWNMGGGIIDEFIAGKFGGRPRAAEACPVQKGGELCT